ncbi:MAG: AmmeMemoRadiSam system protein B, partial [Candidatus Omnitrophica bacterium]|nr:AmmeMemoRadiSam system protein B [Candidatus Omnitrophota bacterium]
MVNVFSAIKKFPGFGNRFFILIILWACFIALTVTSCGAQEIKQPNVSGTFYPSDSKALSSQIDSYLDKAVIPEIKENIIALISPHAGYVYSGPVAAFGYKAIKQRSYKTVIILASSHYYDSAGISVWPGGKFRTPLGDIEVDAEFAAEITKRMKQASFI